MLNVSPSILRVSNLKRLRTAIDRRGLQYLFTHLPKYFAMLITLSVGAEVDWIDCPDNAKQGTPELSEYVYNHLKQVKICSTSNEIEFAIYLLKHAIVLEEMVITQENTFIGRGQVWDEVKCQKIFQNMCDRLPGFSGSVELLIE
ncbi:unnamed protein product [Dovyalis caffra]|uniref:FBD domain-containing protein n=1 Tax=Dovyalis caffra TaxID=77055 RepID=A0AAV1S6L5_9ROSI|nr:unnamed protein product [Dovyalis caffra]